MTEELKTRSSFNTLLIAIGDILMAAVIIPVGIYLVKSTIELKTEIAELKSESMSREEIIHKGDLIRAGAIEMQTELAKLRAQVEILTAQFKEADDKNHKK